jgi:hypothetical protein
MVHRDPPSRQQMAALSEHLDAELAPVARQLRRVGDAELAVVVRTVPMPVATLVTIAGEVDIATVGVFRRHLLAVPDATPSGRCRT